MEVLRRPHLFWMLTKAPLLLRSQKQKICIAALRDPHRFRLHVHGLARGESHESSIAAASQTKQSQGLGLPLAKHQTVPPYRPADAKRLKDLFGSSPAAAPPADSAVCADPRSTAPQLHSSSIHLLLAR